ncbi:MAG: EamA family transporter [Firmicutes bacterium]|nr:EamA family transporter [Bacillota bacterium]
MSISLILISLSGAVCWGLAPIFGKLGLSSVEPMDGLAARTMITLAFLLSWLVLTNGFARVWAIPSKDWLNLGMEAFFATLAGDLAYYAALKWGGAGVSAVVFAVSPVITIGLSNLVFQEAFTLLQIVGVIMVGFGILLVVTG